MVFALLSALIGSCFAFPGFRTAQMSRDAAKNVSYCANIFLKENLFLTS